MKVEYLVITCILLFSCGQEKTNSLTEKNLEGKVKSVTTTAYSAVKKFGELQTADFQYSNIDNYDISGNIIEQSSTGWMAGKYIYKYDKHGNKTDCSSYDAGGELRYLWTYNYDEKGNKTEEIGSNSEGSLGEKSRFKYDKYGNQIEHNSYDAAGNLKEKKTFKYDGKGKQIEKNSFDAFSSLIGKSAFTYDRNGNMIEIRHYKPDGTLEGERTIKYDTQGNEIESSGHTLSYGFYKNTNTYINFDNEGNWTEKHNLSDYTIDERKIVYYD